MGGGEHGSEGDGGWPVGSDAHGHDIAAKGCEILALVVDAIGGISGDGTGRVERQLTVVAGVGTLTGETEVEVAEGLVRHAVVGAALHMLGGQVLGFLVAALPNQLAHLGQVFQGLGVGVVVGLPGPDGLLVQLQPVGGHIAVDHGPQTAVADGKGLVPVLCRSVVPQQMLAGGMHRTGIERGEQDENHQCGLRDGGPLSE